MIMNKRIIITIAVLISIVGISAGFISINQNVDKTNSKKNINSSNPTVIENKYYEFKAAKKENTKVNNELFYEIKGDYNHSITNEELSEAKILADLIPYFPKSMVTEYISVEISTISNGMKMRSITSDDKLSQEQKNLLNSVETASTINIDINYKTKVPVTNVIENGSKTVALMVVPEVEAEFKGGYDNLIEYLTENSDVSANRFEGLDLSSVTFTVNEKGNIVNVRMSKTSGNSNIDESLVYLIENMPRWKPAENSDGISVKQDFEFRIGLDGC